jgi:hypothetical protein
MFGVTDGSCSAWKICVRFRGFCFLHCLCVCVCVCVCVCEEHDISTQTVTANHLGGVPFLLTLASVHEDSVAVGVAVYLDT